MRVRFPSAVHPALRNKRITQVEVCNDCKDESRFATIALAFELKRRPKSFQLKAIVEDWDQQRLIREMF